MRFLLLPVLSAALAAVEPSAPATFAIVGNEPPLVVQTWSYTEDQGYILTPNALVLSPRSVPVGSTTAFTIDIDALYGVPEATIAWTLDGQPAGTGPELIVPVDADRQVGATITFPDPFTPGESIVVVADPVTVAAVQPSAVVSGIRQPVDGTVLSVYEPLNVYGVALQPRWSLRVPGVAGDIPLTSPGFAQATAFRLAAGIGFYSATQSVPVTIVLTDDATGTESTATVTFNGPNADGGPVGGGDSDSGGSDGEGNGDGSGSGGGDDGVSQTIELTGVAPTGAVQIVVGGVVADIDAEAGTWRATLPMPSTATTYEVVVTSISSITVTPVTGGAQ